MFIQVLQGRIPEPGPMRARLRSWEQELGPSARGWLGTTAGVTDDGEFVAVVRFSDEAAALANAERPEQGRWWSETKRLFDDPPTFHDYPHTELLLGGGSDDAGFVQVTQGTYLGGGTPVDLAPSEEELARLRPDHIGVTYAWDDDGHFTTVGYFTSEEDARRGERAMADDPQAMEALERRAASVDGLRFLDLTDPWLASP